MRGRLEEAVASSPACAAIKLQIKSGHVVKPPQQDTDPWGFAWMPSLGHLYEVARDEVDRDRGRPSEEGRTSSSDPLIHSVFYNSLLNSRSFHSQHCEVAMSEALGLKDHLNGLAGSTVLGAGVAADEVEAKRSRLKNHINMAWSDEAVRQGVSHAVAGKYAEAHSCYNKSLELMPTCVKAFVARGAAYANQRCFDAAESDFRRALALDPENKNAAQYLEKVMMHQPRKSKVEHVSGLLDSKASKRVYSVSPSVCSSSSNSSSDDDSKAEDAGLVGVVGPSEIRKAIEEVLKGKEKKKHSKKSKGHKKHKRHKSSSSKKKSKQKHKDR